MRFHLVSLPHTQTTRAFEMCAYTTKVRKFADMMTARGHEVFLYAGEQNEAKCTELVPCITEDERQSIVGDKPFVSMPFDPALPHWIAFNHRAIAGMATRAKPGDFILLSAGRAQSSIAVALPQYPAIEFCVGYSGTFSPYRVFESQAWRHACYGAAVDDASKINGNWQDDVIPSYFDPSEFPFEPEKDNYFLFIGRITPRKGYTVAIEACQRAGRMLTLAGELERGVEEPKGPRVLNVGVVGPKVRSNLMAKARAVFVPTIYCEPFGNVAVEAQLCGTPVITSPWGAFTETVEDGVTGWLCHTMREFVEAMVKADKMTQFNYESIRDRAQKLYSFDAVAPRYERYFERVAMLRTEKGWYA